MEHQLLVDTLRMLSDRLEHLEYHAKLDSLHQQAKIEDHPHRERIEHLQAQLDRAITVHHVQRKYSPVPDCITGETYLGTRTISFDKMTQIINQYREYIYHILKKKILFNFAAKDVPLMTPPGVALNRNRMLGKWMPTNCIVVDMGAGSGTDTLSFFNHMKPKTVYAIEDASDMMRNRRLKENMRKFTDAMEFDPEIIQFRFDGYEAFMNSGEVKDIDLLYVDPPWLLHGSDKEATPQEIVDFVNTSVLQPMKRSNTQVHIMCIKLRYPWDQCSSLLVHLNEGITETMQQYSRIMEFDATPFKRQISFHFFKRNDPIIHEHIPDAYENAIYKGIPVPEDVPFEPWNNIKYDKARTGETKQREVVVRRKGQAPARKIVKETQILDPNGQLVDLEFWENLRDAQLRNQGRR